MEPNAPAYGAQQLEQILKDLKSTINGNSALSSSMQDLIKAETEYTKLFTDLTKIGADITKNQAKQIEDLKKSIRESQIKQRFSVHSRPPQKRRNMSAKAYEWANKIEDMANFVYDIRPVIEVGSRITPDRVVADMMRGSESRDNVEAIKEEGPGWYCFEGSLAYAPYNVESGNDCQDCEYSCNHSMHVRYDGRHFICRLGDDHKIHRTNVQTDLTTIMKVQAKEVEDLQRSLREAQNKERLSVHGGQPQTRMRLSDEADKWAVAIEDVADFLYEFRPVIETGSYLSQSEATRHILIGARTKEQRENVCSIKRAEPDCWFCFESLQWWGAEAQDAKILANGDCKEDDEGCMQVRYDGRHLVCRHWDDLS